MKLGKVGCVVFFLSLQVACSTIHPVADPVMDAPHVKAGAMGRGDAMGLDSDVSREDLPSMPLSGAILYRFLVAELALYNRYFDLSAGQYLVLARETLDPRLIHRAARVAVLAQDNQLLLQVTKLWLTQSPESEEARKMAVIAQIRAGDVDLALQLLDALVPQQQASPGLDSFQWLTALSPHGQGMVTAIDVLDRFIKGHQENVAALFAYAHLASRLGHFEQALIATEEILLRYPAWSDAAVMKVRILQMQKQSGQAITFLNAMVKAAPEVMPARLMLARLLMAGGRIEEALAQFEVINEQQSGDPDILFALAVINLQMDRMDAGERYLLQVKALGQREDDVSYYQGRIAAQRKQWVQAIQFYGLVQQGANYPDARVRLALSQAKLGRIRASRAVLHRLRANLPGQAKRSYVIEAGILGADGRGQEALDVYQLALKAFPDDPGILYARAMLAEEMNRLDILERDLKAIIKVYPDNINALNSLGYTLADQTDRYTEAYGYIKRAYDKAPGSNAILDSMGWVLFKMGRAEEAIAYLERSMSLQPDHEVAAHLGEALWASGAQDKARAVWDDALKQFPDDPLILDVMRRLTPAPAKSR